MGQIKSKLYASESCGGIWTVEKNWTPKSSSIYVRKNIYTFQSRLTPSKSVVVSWLAMLVALQAGDFMALVQTQLKGLFGNREINFEELLCSD